MHAHTEMLNDRFAVTCISPGFICSLFFPVEIELRPAIGDPRVYPGSFSIQCYYWATDRSVLPVIIIGFGGLNYPNWGSVLAIIGYTCNSLLI